jgi:hypothetical protein
MHAKGHARDGGDGNHGEAPQQELVQFAPLLTTNVSYNLSQRIPQRQTAEPAAPTRLLECALRRDLTPVTVRTDLSFARFS